MCLRFAQTKHHFCRFSTCNGSYRYSRPPPPSFCQGEGPLSRFSCQIASAYMTNRVHELPVLHIIVNHIAQRSILALVVAVNQLTNQHRHPPPNTCSLGIILVFFFFYMVSMLLFEKLFSSYNYFY